MPIDKALRAFADENFEGDNYYPVSHGQATLIKPLALAVKKRRPFYKRPFVKWELIVTAGLKDYVVMDKREEFTETVKSAIKKEEDLGTVDEEGSGTETVKSTIKKEENLGTVEEDGAGASSVVKFGLEAAKCINVKVKVADDLGELELGKLDEEFFNDPDLRDILAKTALDINRMKGVESHKLRLVYSVVYSERFVLKGKRKHEVAVGAELEPLPPGIPGIDDLLAKHAQFKVKYKKEAILSKVAARSTRGAVFFKCVRVDYDKDEGKLKLCEGEIVGHDVAPERGGEDDKEFEETMVGLESDLSDSLTEDDLKKVEIIKKAVLIPEKNREKRKQRVKKYLQWFEDALMKDQKKLYLDEPFTPEDRDFLQSIYCPALPGNQSIVDLPPSFNSEKIQGYAIVLKQIDDLSDEQWDKIEKAWAEPE